MNMSDFEHFVSRPEICCEWEEQQIREVFLAVNQGAGITYNKMIQWLLKFDAIDKNSMIEESIKKIMCQLEDMGLLEIKILALKNFKDKEVKSTEIIDFKGISDDDAK